MGNPPSEPTFLWEGGLLEGKDEVVEVNQRALIDKVLARYSAPFVVFSTCSFLFTSLDSTH